MKLGCFADPPTAAYAPRRSPSGRHRAQLGRVRRDDAGGPEIRGEDHVVQQPDDRRPKLIGRADQVQRPPCALRQRRPVTLGRHVRATDEQGGPAGVARLEHLDGGRGPVYIGHRDRVGERAQGGGEGGLVARLDGEQRGDTAEQAGHLSAPASSAPAPSLRRRPSAEGLLAGLPGGRPSSRRRAPGCPAHAAGRQRLVRGDRDLVPLVQLGGVRSPSCAPAAARRYVGLRVHGPRPRALLGDAQAGRSRPRPPVARVRRALTWPASLARPSRRSAIA